MRAAKRATTPPPPVPEVTPVALRDPDGINLTDLLTAAARPEETDTDDGEIEGHAAHERLRLILSASS